MRCSSLIILLAFFCSCSFTQDRTDTTFADKINWTRTGIVGGITLGSLAYVYSVQDNIWWKGEKSSFHFEWSEDWTYALGSDKFGHFYFPYSFTIFYSDVLKWCGFDERKSIIYSAGLAFFYQTLVEIRDGFSARWGFSWGDFGANLLGSLYPVLQKEYPYLDNFRFKISYYPSKRFREGSHRVILDDYESTYNWLSFNIKNLLPEEAGRYFPSFINIAIGHSVKKLYIDDEKHHELFVSLDWNVEALPGDTGFLKFLKKTLNLYHFPAPAVKIYPDFVWYGLKF